MFFAVGVDSDSGLFFIYKNESESEVMDSIFEMLSLGFETEINIYEITDEMPKEDLDKWLELDNKGILGNYIREWYDYVEEHTDDGYINEYGCYDSSDVEYE